MRAKLPLVTHLLSRLGFIELHRLSTLTRFRYVAGNVIWTAHAVQYRTLACQNSR